MDERWADISELEGCYQVSDNGRVRSLDRYVRGVAKNGAEYTYMVRGQILKLHVKQLNLVVTLCVEGGRIYKNVGPLVLSAFIGPRPKGMECRHLDGDLVNCALPNLAWGTHDQNMADAIQHGTAACLRRGDQAQAAKISDADVAQIRTSDKTTTELIAIFGVSRSWVNQIRRGEARL